MGPDFLCIGAPRCGTTWMYQNLNRHPQIQDLPGKELKFISGHKSPKEKAARVVRWTARWQRINRNSPEQLNWGLDWLERYARLEENLETYLTLFDIPAGKLSGDMSPDFCRMSRAEVRDIRNGLGDIRVFMLARDPIERDWSYAQLYLQYDKATAQQCDAAYIKFIESRKCQGFDNYLKIGDLWGETFDNFKIFYFDDIKKRPRELMRDVCEFLGMDPEPRGFKVSEMAPNPTSRQLGEFVRSPEVYEAQKRISEPLMAELKARLGGYPAAWYERHYGVAAG